MPNIPLSTRYTVLATAIGLESWTWDPKSKILLCCGEDRGTAQTMDEAVDRAQSLLLKAGKEEFEEMHRDILQLQKDGHLSPTGGWFTRAAYNLSEALRLAREEVSERYTTVRFGAYLKGNGFCEIIARIQKGIPDSGVPYWPDSYVPGTPDRVISVSAVNSEGVEVRPGAFAEDTEKSLTYAQMALAINTAKVDLSKLQKDRVYGYVHLPVIGTCQVVGKFEPGSRPSGRNGPPENYDPGEPDRVDLVFLADIRPVGVSYDFDDLWGALVGAHNTQYAQRIVDDVEGYLLRIYETTKLTDSGRGEYGRP